ncbi:AGZA family xanthine/uracil permease-like MFS transporter [Desulfitispora alkaliphila]|uniref:NCS2 family permease n=1 Tax=Desulfitispora alkaliphila TaxID=622674 RepID=UPI003D24B32A
MSNPQANFLDKFFKLSERNTDVKTEIIAGLTTFITMSYIIFVNPDFLTAAGIPQEAAIGATILASAFATLLMGLYANFPIGLAPGMGLNAFFTYTIVLGMDVPWETALGAVFISGIIFVILTVTKARQAIIKAVPQTLRSAIAVGIGLFIALIGLKNAGIIIGDDITLVALGDLGDPLVQLAIFGVLVTGVLVAKRVTGAFLIGMFITTVVAMIFGFAQVPKSTADIFSTQLPSIAPTFMQMDILGALSIGLITVVFSFTFVDLFDTIGTFMGVTQKAGMVKEDGNVPGMDKALMCDSVGTVFGAAVGTSTTTSYVESAAGTEAGGRTGLTAVTVGVMFLLALFFAPLVAIVPGVATAPILVLVGVLMMSEVTKIKFSDFTEAFPAFMTIFLMPMTFSIAQGIAFGFTGYAIMKTATGRWNEVGLVMYILAFLFIIQFAFFGH